MTSKHVAGNTNKTAIFGVRYTDPDLGQANM